MLPITLLPPILCAFRIDPDDPLLDRLVRKYARVNSTPIRRIAYTAINSYATRDLVQAANLVPNFVFTFARTQSGKTDYLWMFEATVPRKQVNCRKSRRGS